MKKITFAGISISILLLCLILHSCIPTPPGGNPTPGTTFTVNLEANVGSTANKTVVLDGDTIKFELQSIVFFSITNYLIVSTNSPDFEILNVKKYFYDNYNTIYDSTSTLADVNTLNQSVLISDSYAIHPWQPFINFNLNGYPYVSLSIVYQNADGVPWLTNGLRPNTDEYLVLRKLKGSQYQYYWIKLRREEILPGLNQVKVLNGKYRMNGITTGL